VKTYKRELAIVLILWLVYIVEVKDVQIIELLVWPVFSFAAAAFGFDQYSKLQQTNKSSSGGHKRSSQRTGGQDKYPDAGDDK
jgi:hypothetical protein